MVWEQSQYQSSCFLGTFIGHLDYFLGTCILMERYFLSVEKPLWKKQIQIWSISPWKHMLIVCTMILLAYCMAQQTGNTFPLEYRSLENTSKWPIKVPRKDEEEVYLRRVVWGATFCIVLMGKHYCGVPQKYVKNCCKVVWKADDRHPLPFQMEHPLKYSIRK